MSSRYLYNGTRTPVVVPPPPPLYVRCIECGRVFRGLGRAIGWKCPTPNCTGKASTLRPATKLDYVGQDKA